MRFSDLLTPNNIVSFDYKEIDNNIVSGVRNVCSNLVVLGCGLPDYPYEVVDHIKYFNMFNSSLGCINCKYRNNKKLCKVNCVPSRI